MADPLRVLIVEDSLEDMELILRQLGRNGYEIQAERVETAEAMRQALKSKTWDIILADDAMPQFSSRAALDVMKELGIDLPFIIVSGSIQQEAAVKAMSAGARDYLLKQDLGRLLPAVEREVRTFEIQQKARETIRDYASRDPLTGLPNRIVYEARLREALVYAKQKGKRLAVIFLDLDGLKTINHTFGHSMGDLLLQYVAKRLAGCLSPAGVLARLGGDEFLLLEELGDNKDPQRIARGIIETLQQPFRCEEEELHVTTHLGISLYPDDGEQPETLLRNADTSLYHAKEHGKNNFQLYEPGMSSEAERKLILEHSLRRALKRKEFILHYQPQVDLKTGKIVAAEALIRWQNPEFGLVYPEDFISIAEKTGLIVPIGDWVLRTACAQNKAWQNAGLPRLTIAVNLSLRQFQKQDLAQEVAAVVRDSGMDPANLELEITESFAMQNADFTIGVLKDLKKMGVRVSIDDFGTGYSSLSYLKQFPIDTLKIDRSFVRDLSKDPNDAAIAAAVVVLAHSLKLQVVAEGVETPEQLTILRTHHCDKMQGHLFSRPVTSVEFEKLLREKRSLA